MEQLRGGRGMNNLEGVVKLIMALIMACAAVFLAFQSAKHERDNHILHAILDAIWCAVMLFLCYAVTQV